MSERQRAPGVEAGPLWPTLIRIVLYVSVGTAVFAATFVVLVTSAIVSRIARRCVWWWKLAGLRRRLMIAMVLSYLMASVAVDSGLTLPQDAAAAGAGAAGVALFGGWLWMDKRRGQQQWERKKQSREGVEVVDGGIEDAPRPDDAQLERLAALHTVDHARLDLLETRVRDLLALMADASDGVIPGWPDHQATGPIPRLSVVPENGEASLTTPASARRSRRSPGSRAA